MVKQTWRCKIRQVCHTLYTRVWRHQTVPEKEVPVSGKESGLGKKLVSPRHTRQSVFMYEKDIHTQKKLNNITKCYKHISSHQCQNISVYFASVQNLVKKKIKINTPLYTKHVKICGNGSFATSFTVRTFIACSVKLCF